MPGEGSSTLISIVTVVALFALWWVATHYGWIRDIFLPTPETNRHELRRSMERRHPGRPAAARAFWCELVPRLRGVPAGLRHSDSGRHRDGRLAHRARHLRSADRVLRPLPPLAYLPLIVIWFGIEETAKIMLIFLACFAPLAMAARAGVKSVMIEQINAAYSMGASKWQVIWHVIIPAAMPEIFTGMRIAIGFGWTTLVAAEMVAANAGLGRWC